ncbi:histone-like nucleoid-structuring protein Lsr2 [Mycobacterium avium]|uniref:histone-like nucleoid-structuring protein Lsr2 n=1 Tax=Mycobacterium avium TaxID=1764 RepID=UPI0009BD7F07
MAKKVTVTLVDDFDGAGAADETVEFGLDGVTYEIDLSSKNAAKLRNDLKQWVEAGRPAAGARACSPGAGLSFRWPRNGRRVAPETNWRAAAFLQLRAQRRRQPRP